VRVLALVSVATAAPLVGLLWLGFRVLDQDRQLERQQVQERLERSADVVAGAIQRQIAKSEQALAAGTTDWPDGAVTLTITPDGPMVSPPGRIAFLPVQPPARRPDDQRFATADALLQKHDFSGAFAALESPAADAKPLATRPRRFAPLR
jgi:hypothetical protein